MKKFCIIVSCCVALLFSGCVNNQKYQRIRFSKEALGEALAEHIVADTVVINNANNVFPAQLPIYKITERRISQQEFKETQDKLNLPSDANHIELDGNSFSYSRVSYTDSSRGFFDMTDEELEKEAWRIFNKIPFLEGEYEYLGIKRTMTLIDSEGEHITRAGVQFQRLLDGIRVAGDESCVLYFDGSGFVEAHIKLYDYEQIGTMEMIPLKDAEAKIKAPDDFSLGSEAGTVQTLAVDQVKLLLVNQYSSGCTILQPIYSFIGTATMKDGDQAEFSSKIIAIPESYTYEVE